MTFSQTILDLYLAVFGRPSNDRYAWSLEAMWTRADPLNPLHSTSAPLCQPLRKLEVHVQELSSEPRTLTIQIGYVNL